MKDSLFQFQDANKGLKSTSISQNDGKISCSFVRDKQVELDVPKGEKVTIDLKKNKYRLELAIGPLDSSTGNIAHHTKAAISDMEFDFTK